CLDEVGYVDRWAHLHVVDARPGATPRQLTAGDWGVSGIAWAPNGRSIAYVADPRADADLRPRTSIWSIEADDEEHPPPTAAPREVLALGGNVTATGRTAAPPERLLPGDVATHSIAVAADPEAPADRRVTLLACLGSRPVELLTVPLAEKRPRPVVRSRIGGGWAAGMRWPEMRSH